MKIFLDDYCKQWGIQNARYEIQGSVQFKSHPLDPDVNDVPVLTRDGNILTPDDLDGRIYISKHQANKFLKKIKKYHRDVTRNANPTWNSKKVEKEVNEIMKPILNSANKNGIIHKKWMPPGPYTSPNSYMNKLQQAVKRNDGSDIFYPLNNKIPPYSEVGFSIIIKNTAFDIDPVISLKP